jgi:hypothetical protein
MAYDDKNSDSDTGMDVLPPVNGVLAEIIRAEIDQQIATAHAYPRSLKAFKTRAIEMATFDEETAASCIYSRPVGKKKNEQSGKFEEQFAEGMSIRMAEIVGNCYGNLRVGATLVEQTDRFVKARGVAHDLETNFASASEVIESTVTREGRPYSERMRIVIAKAVVSKARRDATFSVVPRALCKPIEEAARKVAIGDATTLAKRRDAVMAWIGKLGIDKARVFAALGIQDEEGIGLEQLTILTGLKTSIKDNDVTVDEAFPPLGGDSAGSLRPRSKSAGATDGQPVAGAGAPAPKADLPPPAGDTAAAAAETVQPQQQAQVQPAAEPETQTGATAEPGADKPITDGNIRLIRVLLKQKGVTEEELCKAHNISDLTKASAAQGGAMIGFIQKC